MAVSPFSSGGVAIRYVFPVLWTTSCLYIVTMNRRRNSDSIGSSVDLSPWRVLKLTRRGAASEFYAMQFVPNTPTATTAKGRPYMIPTAAPSTSLVPKQVGLDLSYRNTGCVLAIEVA